MLALGACASSGVLEGMASQPQAQAARSETFSLVTQDELTRDMPHLTPEGDAKAYVASFIHWVLMPGHMVERSSMLATGAPPDLSDPREFSSIVRDLSDQGNSEATLFKVIGSASDMGALSANAHPTAQFFLQTRRLHQGSLFERIDALAWLRREAVTNKDAAFALGGFLIDQGATQDNLGVNARLLATPAEIAEGTRLLKGVAAHTTLESLAHIADLLADALNTPAGDPVALRNLLELTVAATSTTPAEDNASFSSIALELGGGSGVDATYQAAGLRVGLAALLETGKGGPADVERAKGLYLEALKATEDNNALKALKRLGEDVSAYETPDEPADARPRARDDGWEDE